MRRFWNWLRGKKESRYPVAIFMAHDGLYESDGKSSRRISEAVIDAKDLL